MNRYKVPCFYIGGLADSERHAWNVVLLDDGEYHCVDCTWDDSYYIEGTKRVRILGCKYFNMPYTNFYTDGQRDNSSLSLTQMIPQLSENTNFYNKDYLTKEYYQLSYTTTANNIRIYPAPSVTYKKTRVYSTASDMTLIPLISNESYTGDFTETANFYRIVKSGGDFVKVGENTGSIVLARNASNTFFAYGTGDGSLSFLTNTGVKLSFKAGFKDGKLEIYADGKDALIAEKEASEYTQTISLNIPADTHKITVKYTGGSLIQINAVVAHPFADIDNNGKVNILDAIALASAPYPETTSNYADYTIYDVDGNNVIDDMDIKAILKAAISAL